MNITIDAIFEDGVLKPLGPVALPEHERVQISIQRQVSPHPEDNDPEVLARQQQAIRELLAELRTLPTSSDSEPFSGQDHDRILYERPA